MWDDEQLEWYFSIVDVCQVLTESKDPQAYWRKLEQRLKDEGNETVTNCHALKMRAADGKMRLTDLWFMSNGSRLRVREELRCGEALFLWAKMAKLVQMGIFV